MCYYDNNYVSENTLELIEICIIATKMFVFICSRNTA